MNYEITEWKLPADFGRVLVGLDAMVAIAAGKANKPTALYLYDADYNRIRHAAKINLPEGASLEQVTFRGIPVRNGGTKASKRPVHYTPTKGLR